MIEFLLVFALLGQVGPPAAAAAQKAPEVDTSEAVRRGESVTVVGEGPRGPAEEAARLAVAPPPDDSSKWFVTVWVGPNCGPCNLLKKHFREHAALSSFVSAPAGQIAWAHYNEYRVDDETQKTRRKAYQITKWPTIVVQPPCNGMWGEPRTVVFYEQGYDGNPGKLSERISAAVKKFSEVRVQQGYPRVPNNGPRYGTKDLKFEELEASELKEGAATPRPFLVQGAAQPAPEGNSNLIGQGPYYGPPPFPQPPQVDPFNPNLPYGPQPNQTIPPSIPPATPSPLPGGMGSLFTGTNLLLALLFGMEVLKRLAPVTTTKVDDLAVGVLTRLQAMGVIPQRPAGGSVPGGPTP